jgi:hypothetical protein
MERMEEEEISRYELRRLLGYITERMEKEETSRYELGLLCYIGEHEFGGNISIFAQFCVQLCTIYLKTKQIGNLLKRALEEIENMPPNFLVLADEFLEKINIARNGDNLEEKLYCIIVFFRIAGRDLCDGFAEICPLENVRLITKKLRNHFTNTGTKVPTKEEIAQEFDAEITQQRNANEQRNLQEAQQEVTEPREEATTL